ncbi:phage integrase SAM-like domain-containing protein [uncultured Porphyromonas sp.]|uniref:phage integrase SAM-like domain-containing protein n=1 Tax=uncultured Porphyromonas sp. TaxID=159274 RepID=UPI003434733D
MRRKTPQKVARKSKNALSWRNQPRKSVSFSPSPFFKGLELYLKGVKNYTHNAVIKVLRFLKKAMERAVEEELLMRVPFPKVVLRTQPTDRGA